MEGKEKQRVISEDMKKMKEKDIMPIKEDYVPFLKEIKGKITSARIKAYHRDCPTIKSKIQFFNKFFNNY